MTDPVNESHQKLLSGFVSVGVENPVVSQVVVPAVIMIPALSNRQSITIILLNLPREKQVINEKGTKIKTRTNGKYLKIAIAKSGLCHSCSQVFKTIFSCSILLFLLRDWRICLCWLISLSHCKSNFLHLFFRHVCEGLIAKPSGNRAV